MSMPAVQSDGAKLKSPISTGNGEVDKRIGGGLPRQSLTLVEGQSDAGKSVLVQHLCWGGVTAEEHVTVYTTENTVKSLMRQMDSLGMDLSDYYLLGRMRVLPVHLRSDGPSSGEALQLLYRHMEEAETSVIVVDSLTGMLVKASDEEVLDFFAGCKRLCDQGKTIIVCVHSYAFEQHILVRVRSLCDAHLHLRIEQVGEQLVKVLEVAKVRGAERTTGNIVSFDVEPGLGIRLIPVTRAKA